MQPRFKPVKLLFHAWRFGLDIEKIEEIVLDPEKETADIDERNNSWPKKEDQTDFDKFKSNVKG